MKKIILPLLIALVLFCSQHLRAEQESKNYQRIISFSPSITEILYALGLEDKLVGVTRYCLYPPQAQEKPNIGGLFDINYEQVYRLEPDLLILAVDNGDYVRKFEKMGLEVMTVETRSVKEILKSIGSLGRVFGKENEASALVEALEKKIAAVESSVSGLDQPRVLITFLRPMGEGNVREAYIAGNHTYFDDLIQLAGGVNAYQGGALITSPLVTMEGIIQMNPDVVIEIVSMVQKPNLTKEDVLSDWTPLSSVNAVKNKQIYVFDQPFASIPGPRFVDILEDMGQAIHPKKFNKNE